MTEIVYVPTVTAPAPTVTPAVDWREQLGQLDLAVTTAQVHSQRIAHAKWSDIGRTLGVTRQAARQRWMWVDDEPVVLCVETVDGERQATFRSAGTRAAVGRLQLAEVAELGRIEHHHEDVAALQLLRDHAAQRALNALQGARPAAS